MSTPLLFPQRLRSRKKGRTEGQSAKWRFRDLIELSAIHGGRWDKRLGDSAMSGGNWWPAYVVYASSSEPPKSFKTSGGRDKRGGRECERQLWLGMVGEGGKEERK